MESTCKSDNILTLGIWERVLFLARPLDNRHEHNGQYAKKVAEEDAVKDGAAEI